MSIKKLKWRERLILRTPRQARVGGWKDLLDGVASGNVVVVVPWLRPGASVRHDPMVVMVPAQAIAGEPGLRIVRHGSHYVRQSLLDVCQQAEQSWHDDAPEAHVVSWYRVAQGRARVKGDERRQSAASEGSDIAAIVSAEWFAQRAGVTLAELKELAHDAYTAEMKTA